MSSQLNVTAFLLLLAVAAFSQDSTTNNILTTKKFRPGIYILVIGKILYFDDFRAKRNAIANRTGLTTFGLIGGAVSQGIGGSVARKNPGWVIYMPDDTGDAFILDRKTMNSILHEADPELFEKFKAEKEKNDYNLLLTYMLDFNTRHPVE